MTVGWKDSKPAASRPGVQQPLRFAPSELNDAGLTSPPHIMTPILAAVNPKQ